MTELHRPELEVRGLRFVALAEGAGRFTHAKASLRSRKEADTEPA